MRLLLKGFHKETIYTLFGNRKIMHMNNKYCERFYNSKLHRIETRMVDRRVKEYYHGSSGLAGIEPFVTHVTQYFDGTRTVPVTKAPSISHENLFFTFTDNLLRMFLDNLERIKKPYECAYKYGFLGYSKGGKSGIFLVRKQDYGLVDASDLLKEKDKGQIVQDLDCSLSAFPDLKNVKIVYHNPSSERVVGVMNQINGRAIFLGFGQY